MISPRQWYCPTTGESPSDYTERVVICQAAHDDEAAKQEQQTGGVVGLCPDICPEFERYRREQELDFNWLETDDLQPRETKLCTFSHRMAVKAYKRPAAGVWDLAVEVRPEPVLRVAMLHLCTHHLQLWEGVLSENVKPAFEKEMKTDWFTFIENRLRSLKKDLKLQQLYSPGAIELLEQTVRFHIIAGHHMCPFQERSQSGFVDHDRQREITDAMSQLMQAYADALDPVACKNEPEFQAYQIYIGLRDQGTLRLARRWSKRVLASNEVKEAIELYCLAQTGNYIRFFKLARATTVTNACALFQHFDWV